VLCECLRAVCRRTSSFVRRRLARSLTFHILDPSVCPFATVSFSPDELRSVSFRFVSFRFRRGYLPERSNSSAIVVRGNLIQLQWAPL
jgi:hypothetical protein